MRAIERGIAEKLDSSIEGASHEFYEEDGYMHVKVWTDYDAMEDLVDISLELEADVVAEVNRGEYYDLAFRED